MTDTKPECPACGHDDYKDAPTKCPHCGNLKCEFCDAGDDVPCLLCNADDGDSDDNDDD